MHRANPATCGNPAPLPTHRNRHAVEDLLDRRGHRTYAGVQIWKKFHQEPGRTGELGKSTSLEELLSLSKSSAATLLQPVCPSETPTGCSQDATPHSPRTRAGPRNPDRRWVFERVLLVRSPHHPRNPLRSAVRTRLVRGNERRRGSRRGTGRADEALSVQTKKRERETTRDLRQSEYSCVLFFQPTESAFL